MSTTISFSKNDIFILGCLHTLRSLQSVKDDAEDMNDIQWEILIEQQRRNLENPDIERFLDQAESNKKTEEELR